MSSSALPKAKYESRYFPKFEEGLKSQDGKNVVITGTTSGTGLVAAKTALKKGARMALLNRNVEKAKKALEDFFKEHPNVEERATFVRCDLQDFDSVKSAAEEIQNVFSDGVHVLCNNAGIMAFNADATKDGHEVQMQTNHLSHFLLTKELYPLLVKASESAAEDSVRVVNHSSGARYLPLGYLKAKYFQKDSTKWGNNKDSMASGGKWRRYHQTKLANCVFTREMQKRLNKSKSKIMSLCAHPGLAATELQVTTAKKSNGKLDLGFMKHAQSSEDGAMGIIKCMFDDKVQRGALYGPFGMTGKPTKRRHGIFATQSAGKMLWQESEAACGEFKL